MGFVYLSIPRLWVCVFCDGCVWLGVGCCWRGFKGRVYLVWMVVPIGLCLGGGVVESCAWGWCCMGVEGLSLFGECALAFQSEEPNLKFMVL